VTQAVSPASSVGLNDAIVSLKKGFNPIEILDNPDLTMAGRPSPRGFQAQTHTRGLPIENFNRPD
jgi:hypothetical protein